MHGRLLPGVVCIFERDAGDPVWRHFDNVLQTGFEGRRSVELVVRMIAAIGNYDYVLDWTFSQDGRIKVRIGASGYDGLKGVLSRSMRDPTAAPESAYGTLVAPGLVAVNHDHFFSIRLDLDVDGPGHTPGYVLRPGNTVAYSLLATGDMAPQRAMFTTHQLWVTAQSADERYPAGVYVNQSEGGQGLPAWTAADRPIENADIVLWYTAGFHHVPRTGGFPVMPSAWEELELMPFTTSPDGSNGGGVGTLRLYRWQRR